jgi:hypothetical protein
LQLRSAAINTMTCGADCTPAWLALAKRGSRAFVHQDWLGKGPCMVGLFLPPSPVTPPLAPRAHMPSHFSLLSPFPLAHFALIHFTHPLFPPAPLRSAPSLSLSCSSFIARFPPPPATYTC